MFSLLKERRPLGDGWGRGGTSAALWGWAGGSGDGTKWSPEGLPFGAGVLGTAQVPKDFAVGSKAPASGRRRDFQSNGSCWAVSSCCMSRSASSRVAAVARIFPNPLQTHQRFKLLEKVTMRSRLISSMRWK